MAVVESFNARIIDSNGSPLKTGEIVELVHDIYNAGVYLTRCSGSGGWHFKEHHFERIPDTVADRIATGFAVEDRVMVGDSLGTVSSVSTKDEKNEYLRDHPVHITLDGGGHVDVTESGTSLEGSFLIRAEKIDHKAKNTSDVGLRYNAGKPEIHQVPTSLMIAVAEVLKYGENKYAKNNWRKGMDWTIPYDCLLRHMFKWLSGEEKDEESGLSHLSHAAANIAMLIEYSKTHIELDDRYKP